MKKIALFFTTFLLLNSCTFGGSKTKQKEYDYKDFENIKISWNCVLFDAKPQYFVYVYSESCLHCQEIKNDVLKFIREGENSIYLIEANSDIPTGGNIEKTIGAKCITDIWIEGVPTLLEINNKTLTSNVCGTTEVMALLYSKKK